MKPNHNDVRVRVCPLSGLQYFVERYLAGNTRSGWYHESSHIQKADAEKAAKALRKELAQ